MTTNEERGVQKMATRYAVINDAGEIENIIVLEPDSVEEFIASSGLNLRLAKDDDVVIQLETEKSSLSVTLNRSDLETLAAAFDEPLTGTTVSSLKTQVDTQMSKIAGLFRDLL